MKKKKPSSIKRDPDEAISNSALGFTESDPSIERTEFSTVMIFSSSV